jgi:RNA polymerase sigma-70 factor, ECF subfamily
MEKPWEIDLTIYDDENELLHGLRRRDQLACTCLLKNYAPRLLRLAGQLMGDSDEAEDVLQEAFIRACDRIDTFRGESGLGTWLHRIVINTALMRLRQRRPLIDSGDLASSDLQDADWHSVAHEPVEPSAEVLESELLDALGNAIMRLPPSLRTAFILRDVEDLSTREAAALLDISESALKVRLHRARLALRQELANYLVSSATGQQGEQE